MAAGVGGLLLVAPLMSTYLGNVEPRDPLTLGLVLAGLAAVALAASLVPALRAARIEPAITLRAQSHEPVRARGLKPEV